MYEANRKNKQFKKRSTLCVAPVIYSSLIYILVHQNLISGITSRHRMWWIWNFPLSDHRKLNSPVLNFSSSFDSLAFKYYRWVGLVKISSLCEVHWHPLSGLNIEATFVSLAVIWGSVTLCVEFITPTKVFGCDGLEADHLQSSSSQDQLAAPRVEVLHKQKRLSNIFITQRRWAASVFPSNMILKHHWSVLINLMPLCHSGDELYQAGCPLPFPLHWNPRFFMKQDRGVLVSNIAS